MAMLTNGPSCSLQGPHRGKLHQFSVQMFAEADGTPVTDAPEEKTYLCEGHAPPDSDDPEYKLCTCELCLERKK